MYTRIQVVLLCLLIPFHSRIPQRLFMKGVWQLLLAYCSQKLRRERRETVPIYLYQGKWLCSHGAHYKYSPAEERHLWRIQIVNDDSQRSLVSGVNSEGVRVKGLERGSHFSPFPTVQQVSALQTLSNFANNTNRVRSLNSTYCNVFTAYFIKQFSFIV